MKRLLIIAGLIIGLAITHLGAWAIGWKSGFVQMGRVSSRWQLPITMSACRSLQSNDLARVDRLLNMQLSFGIHDLKSIETNEWGWFSDTFEVAIEEFFTSDALFRDVTLARAEALHKPKHRNAQPSPGAYSSKAANGLTGNAQE